MRLPRFVVVAATVSMAACALPDRDNPHDPANLPHARLSVIVLGSTSNQGRRMDTFAIDARESSGQAGKDLVFRFDLDGRAGFERSDEDGYLETRLVIDSAQLPGGVGTVTRIVRVEVAAGDAVAVAEAPAYVSNRPPDLGGLSDVFVPDRRGGEVLLDACGGPCSALFPGSRDDDGDPLTFTWQGPLPFAATDATGREITFSAPLAEQTVVFEVVASDGVASVTERIRVYVGPTLWATTEVPSQALLIHPDSVAIPIDTGAFVSAAAIDQVARGPQGTFLAYFPAFSPSSIVAFVPDFKPPASLFALSGGASMVRSLAAGPAGCVCVASDVAFHVGCPGEVVAFPPQGQEPRFVLPSTSGCWALSDTTLFVLSTSGSLSSPVLSFSDVTAAAATASGAFWIADADGSSGGTELVRVGLSGAELVLSAAFSVDALAEHPDSGLWIHDAGTRDTWHLDESGALSLEASLPPWTAGALVSDVSEGSLWVLDGLSTSLTHGRVHAGLVEVEGHVEVPEFAGTIGAWSSIALDPATGRLVAGGYEIAGTNSFLASIPSHLGRVRSVSSSGPGSVHVSPDPRGGGTWLGDTSLGLRRVDVRGGIRAETGPIAGLRALASRSDGSAEVAVSLGADAALRRYGADASIVGERVFAATDLASVSLDGAGNGCVTGSQAGQPFFGRIEGASLVTFTPSLSGPANSVLAADGGCWVTNLASAHRVAPSSTVATEFSIAPEIPGTCAVADPRDGSVWICSASAPRIVHVTAGGAVTFVNVPAAGEVVGLAATDRCAPPLTDCLDVWVATRSGAQSLVSRLRVDLAGPSVTVVDSYPIVGRLSRLRAMPGRPDAPVP